MLAIGRVHLWQGGSLWIGQGHGRSDWRDHHALQIALALDGVCRFRNQAGGIWSEFKGAIVRSHRHHQFEVDGATMAQLFIEPETVEGRLLCERFVDDISLLPEGQMLAMTRLLGNALRADAKADSMIAVARAATQLLAGVAAPSAKGDGRVDKSIAYIRAHPRCDHARRSRGCRGAVAGTISSSFRRADGYKLSCLSALDEIERGHSVRDEGPSWTEAAHGAGFADSAHLTHTFRRMFGMNPAALVPR